MRILKKGKGSPTDKSARFTCIGCGALIEAKKSEGKYIPDWRDGDYIKMKCPQCGNINSVSATMFQL